MSHSSWIIVSRQILGGGELFDDDIFKTDREIFLSKHEAKVRFLEMINAFRADHPDCTLRVLIEEHESFDDSGHEFIIKEQALTTNVQIESYLDSIEFIARMYVHIIPKDTDHPLVGYEMYFGLNL